MSVAITWPAEGIAQLTIDRDAKRNALSSSLLRELIDALSPVSYTHLTLPTKA